MSNQAGISDYHSKLFAHQLSRRHAANSSEKLAGTLLDAKVDLNPHQVEAALFAFKSPLSKGAILADEVGLGKTIEAGLLLSQRWSEGKRKIIIVGPASLRKQWSQEIEEKFYLPTLILENANYKQMAKQGQANPFNQDKIVICSYQFAAKHAEQLMTVPWNLAVLDEAHRLRNVYKGSKIATTLKTALLSAPKVLLTATPLQNSLMELYGLVSIIDEHTFGDAKSFRSQFARLSADGRFDELKDRLKPVCHRTLRSQVLEYIQYTKRIPLTQEFTPTDNEQALYEAVSAYLQRPALHALPNAQRTLMTLILRKLLASSTFAIAGALQSLANKLRRQLKEDSDLRTNFADDPAPTQAEAEAGATASWGNIVDDYDGFHETHDEWVDDEVDPELLSDREVTAIEQEIDELEHFHHLATNIDENAKGHALLQALSQGFAKSAELGAAQKAIIFTESRKTQDYLVKLLGNNGYEGDLVLFNGSNTDAQSKMIYDYWKAENAKTDKVTGSRTADMRAALVDHFRGKAKIMIATEAAAEGINLQFCSMLVNYDLPWNPQRVEQRIGRCHRYGQKHDVVVINFLNKKNAADKRVHELLSEKFKLFDGVFGASDDVLGAIESGVDFEKRIVGIYQSCRTPDEIEAAFEALQTDMAANIDETMKDTRKKLLENFDADVHERLKVNLDEAREYIDRYGDMLWRLTRHELGHQAKYDDAYRTFTLSKPTHTAAPGLYYLGQSGLEGHRYRLGHPLAQALVNQATQRTLPPTHLVFNYSAWQQQAQNILPFVGQSGVLSVRQLSLSGTNAQDHLLVAAQTDSGQPLPPAAALRLFDLPVCETTARPLPAHELHIDLGSQQATILAQLSEQQGEWMDQELEKLDRWAADRRRGLKDALSELDAEVKELKKQARSASQMPEKLKLQKQIREVEKRRDEAWRTYDRDAAGVEDQKDMLLDRIEEQLASETTLQDLFTITFEIA